MFHALQIKDKSSACRASIGYENGLHSHQRAITLLLGSFPIIEATRSRKGSSYVMAYHGCLQMMESRRRYADTEKNALYGGRVS